MSISIENKIINSVKILPLLFLVLFTLIVSYVISIQIDSYFKEESKKIKNDFISSQKELVKNDVQIVYDLISFEKNNSTIKLKDNLKNRVYEAHNVVQNIYNKNKNLDRTSLTKIIKNSLEKLTFNNGRGYFFIYALDGTNIFHPLLKEIENTNLSQYKDLKGKKVINDLINIANTKSEGFDTWYWKKSNDMNKQYKKFGFIKKIEELDWFIGTGEYLEDFEKDIKSSILNRVSNIKYDRNGYVFIIDYQGNYLNHIKKDLIGKNLIDLKDGNGNYITKKIIDIASNKKEGFASYISIDGTSTKNGANKISFIKGFEDWGWAIGSGFYPEQIDQKIDQKNEEFQEFYKKTKDKILVIIVIVVIFLIILQQMFSRKLEELFNKYKDVNEKYQLKLAEELSEKSTLLDSSIKTIDDYVSITKTNKNGIITYATKNFCDDMGYEKSEIIGKSHNIVRHPKTDPKVFEKLWETVRKGETYKNIIRNRTKIGGEIWFELIVAPDFDTNKNIIGYTAIRKNITDKKIIEDLNTKLEDKVLQAVEKNKEKDYIIAQQSKMVAIGEMIENISHHWRQPLSLISTSASGLLVQKEFDMLDDKKIEDTLKTIVENTQYLSQTIDNFRNFFNSSNKMEKIRSKDLIKKIFTMIDIYDHNSRIILHENIEDIEFTSYQNELIQVLLNIINNSLDAFKNVQSDEDMHIFITLKKSKKTFILTIKDSAGGVPDNILNKIFEPYFTTKHKSVGTGMGLFMCMEIVTKLLYGTITVENQTYEHEDIAYKGAEFCLKIPLDTRTKIFKNISKNFKYFTWDEETRQFVKSENCSEIDLENDSKLVIEFLKKYKINYKVLENKNIIAYVDS